MSDARRLDDSTAMETLKTLWQQHRTTDWPVFQDPQEGHLMTLDTVICGCVLYYLDTPGGLDEQRTTLLQDCLADLEAILPSLAPGEAGAYFSRLRALGELMLQKPNPP